MDKKSTIVAIVLMVALMLGTQFVLQWINPPKPTEAAIPLETPTATPTETTPGTTSLETAAPTSAIVAAIDTMELPSEEIKASTDLYEVVFNTKGASITSFKLKKHLDMGQPLEMVNTFNGGSGSFFEFDFGDKVKNASQVVFAYKSLSDKVFEFSRTFKGLNGENFLVKKVFTLVEGEYILGLKVLIQSENNSIPQISADKYAYSLTIGPQLGPQFKKIDNTQELRKYYYFTGNERKEMEFGKGTQTYSDYFKWAGLMGKYFGVILIPDSGSYSITWNDKINSSDMKDHSTSMTVNRGALKGSVSEDSFNFYLGPKEEGILLKYNKESDNALKFAGLKLETSLDRNPFLGWLEIGMKWVMDVLLNSWINNWGITIILLSFLLRLVLWVPTHKSYESTAAMAAVGPKLSALQEKFKNDPAKLNAAMAELYKKEGINPLGGCLPMLIQIPIMIALWQMLSTHFDLRGAVFIPGWITDLSLPESVFNWGFPLPLLGWTDLRIMPILMVATQILSSMVTQPQSAQQAQMKMLTYALPLVFFFFFYDMPSGLVVYWTVTNVLSMAQQWIINSEIKKKKAAKA